MQTEVVVLLPQAASLRHTIPFPTILVNIQLYFGHHSSWFKSAPTFNIDCPGIPAVPAVPTIINAIGSAPVRCFIMQEAKSQPRVFATDVQAALH
jgi:hypothetical protein